MYSSSENTAGFDAVIGCLQDRCAEEADEEEGIQSQHRCFANIHLLNHSISYREDRSLSNLTSSEKRSKGPSDTISENEDVGPSQDALRESQIISSGSFRRDSELSVSSDDVGYLDVEATRDYCAENLTDSKDSEGPENAVNGKCNPEGFSDAM